MAGDLGGSKGRSSLEVKLSSSDRDSKGRSLEAVGYLRTGGFDPELLKGASASWVKATVCWGAEGWVVFGWEDNLQSIPSSE